MELFTIFTPANKVIPLVANLPHSDMYIPQDIAEQFKQEHLESLPNTDWHLHRVYDFFPSLGINV